MKGLLTLLIRLLCLTMTCLAVGMRLAVRQRNGLKKLTRKWRSNY